MNFKEMMELGKRMSEEERTEQIRTLAGDSRFAAVVGWLEACREAYVRDVSRQDMAGSHGNLAHCGGSIYAVRQQLDVIEGIVDRPPARKRKGTQGEPERVED